MTGPKTTGFHDTKAIAGYADNGPRRQVPGYDSLLRMADLLLAESVPAGGHVLVIGAGGGLELTEFATNHPGWRFTGVDPSAPMLDLARQTMGAMATRADLIQGYTDDAPMGPFDGATCILTLHFVPHADRLPMLSAIRARLRPGAPFVCAHFSVPGQGEARQQWFARYAAFSISNGMDPARAREGAVKVAAELPILTPDDDLALLRAAGFRDVQAFYRAFTFQGWTARA